MRDSKDPKGPILAFYAADVLLFFAAVKKRQIRYARLNHKLRNI